MANRHGDFIWYELLMSDPAAAERFYGPVLGWRARRAEGSPVEYRIFGTGEAEVAGLMAIPPGAGAAGMRPGWIGYIGVDDVDAADQYPGRRPLCPGASLTLRRVGRWLSQSGSPARLGSAIVPMHARSRVRWSGPTGATSGDADRERHIGGACRERLQPT